MPTLRSMISRCLTSSSFFDESPASCGDASRSGSGSEVEGEEASDFELEAADEKSLAVTGWKEGRFRIREGGLLNLQFE